MSSRLRLLAWVGMLSVAGCALSLSSEIKTIRTDYCQPVDDDPGGETERKRMVGLRAMGEQGRRALLKVARDPQFDECALVFLSALDDRRAMPLLREIVDESGSDAFRRNWALSLLAGLGDDWAVNELISLLERADDLPTIRTAMLVLGWARQPQAGAALRRVATDDRFSLYHEILVTALGTQRNPADVPLIVRLAEAERSDLQGGERDMLRLRGAEALATILTPESVAAIPGLMRGPWHPGGSLRASAFGHVRSQLYLARQASSVSPELAKAIDATQATLQQLETAEPR